MNLWWGDDPPQGRLVPEHFPADDTIKDGRKVPKKGEYGWDATSRDKKYLEHKFH